MASSFDLVVIGAGSGGVRAARIAAGHGARVALIEGDRVGGTCVIRGCVPKKLMVIGSRFADAFQEAKGFGWQVEPPVFAWSALREAVARDVSRLEGLYTATQEKAGVTLFRGFAQFTSPHAVALTDGTTLEGKQFLIATGGRPHRPDGVDGVEFASVSDDVFEWPTLPKRLLVVGGGFIALEFAALFQRLGSQVTLVHRGERLLKAADADMALELQDALRETGIDIHLSCTTTRLVKQATGTLVMLNSGLTLEVDNVLMATGRVPYTAPLNLTQAGVEVDSVGAVVVDAYSQTSQPHIYAVGDVTNRVNLTPVAIREGHAFADSVFGGQKRAVDHKLVPWAVFTTPEYAHVGHTEASAQAEGLSTRVYSTRFRPMKATLAGTAERTHMKLVVDATTDRVLGCQMLGADAAEIVQMATIAVSAGLLKQDFDRAVALHPTAAEELVTLR